MNEEPCSVEFERQADRDLERLDPPVRQRVLAGIERLAADPRSAAVDTMTDEEARVALRTFAEASGDPVVWTLDHALLDDEHETDEAVAEARADRERGVQPVPLEDLLAEFGRE